MLSEQALIDFFVSRVARATGRTEDDVPVTEVLADMGMNSLAMLSIGSELETLLGRRVSPTIFLEFATIEELAAHLGGEGE